MQTDLTTKHRLFSNAVAYLNEWQSPHRPTGTGITVTDHGCVENIKLLQTYLLLTTKNWPQRASTKHWITRALLDTLLNEYRMLIAHLELLAETFAETVDLKPFNETEFKNNISVQIAQFSKLVTSMLQLEQRVAPALLAMGEITEIESMRIAPPTLH